MGKHQKPKVYLGRLLRRVIWKRDRGVCQICYETVAFGPLMQLDHIYPERLGGCKHWENLRATHAHCNARRQRVGVPLPTPHCRPRRITVADAREIVSSLVEALTDSQRQSEERLERAIRAELRVAELERLSLSRPERQDDKPWWRRWWR